MVVIFKICPDSALCFSYITTESCLSLSAYFQWIQTQRILSPSSPMAAAPMPLSVSLSRLLHPPDPLLVQQENLSLTFTIPCCTMRSDWPCACSGHGKLSLTFTLPYYTVSSNWSSMYPGCKAGPAGGVRVAVMECSSHVSLS